MPNFPGSLDDDASLYLAVNNARTRLTSGISESELTIPVVTTSGFPNQGFITILSNPDDITEAEAIRYVGISETTFSGVERGAGGTPILPHFTQDNVDLTVMAEHHNELKDATIEIEKILGVSGSHNFVPKDAQGNAIVSGTLTTDQFVVGNITAASGTFTDSLTVSGVPVVTSPHFTLPDDITVSGITASSGIFSDSATVSGAPVLTTDSDVGGGPALTVRTSDNNPTVGNVDTIVVTPGTLTDDGSGQVSLDTGGSSGGGGGTGTVSGSYWVTDAPPVDPSPFDDEFDHFGQEENQNFLEPIDSGVWTEWDPGTTVQQRLQYGEGVGPDGFAFSTGQAGDVWGGFVRDLAPLVATASGGGSSSWWVDTKVKLAEREAHGMYSGLCIGGDLIGNPGTEEILYIALANNTSAAGTIDDSIHLVAGSTNGVLYNSAITLNSEVTDASGPNQTHMYLRMGYTSSADEFFAMYSSDGTTWSQSSNSGNIIASGTLNFDPQTVGLIGRCENPSDALHRFQFFRFRTNQDRNSSVSRITISRLPLLGRRVYADQGGGSSLTVQEQDGIPTVSGVSTIKVTNGTLTDEGNGIISIDTGGSGGSGGSGGGLGQVSVTGTVWNPFLAPASGTAYDDEFLENVAVTGTLAQGDWTVWDPGSSAITVDTFPQGGGLRIRKTNTSDDIQFMGVYKPIPTETSWEAVTYVHMGAPSSLSGADALHVGFGFFDDAAGNPSTTNFVFMGLVQDLDGFKLERGLYSNYDDNTAASVSTDSDSGDVSFHGVFLRATARDGSNTSFDLAYSFDGFGWKTFSYYTFPFTVNEIGIVCSNTITSSLMYYGARFFRIDPHFAGINRRGFPVLGNYMDPTGGGGGGGGTGDGNITDINTQEGPSITITGTSGVEVVTEGNVLTISGSPFDGNSRWDPFIPPPSGNPFDDEFDTGVGSAIDAKWTTFDPGSDISSMSIRENPNRLFVNQGNNDEFGGIIQPRNGTSDGDFSAITYVSISTRTSGFDTLEHFAGIAFVEDKDAPTTSNILLFGVHWDKTTATPSGAVPFSVGGWEFDSYTAGETVQGTELTLDDFTIPGVFIRVRYWASANLVDADWSLDGAVWHEYAQVDIDTGPTMNAFDSIGLLSRAGGDSQHYTNYRFFRLLEISRGLSDDTPAGILGGAIQDPNFTEMSAGTGTFTDSLTISGVPVSIGPGGGASTLQEAYDGGDGTISTTGGKPFELTGTGEMVAVTGTFTDGLTVGGASTYINDHNVIATSGTFQNLTVSGVPVSIGPGGGGSSSIDDINGISTGSVVITGTNGIDTVTEGNTITVSGVSSYVETEEVTAVSGTFTDSLTVSGTPVNIAASTPSATYFVGALVSTSSGITVNTTNQEINWDTVAYDFDGTGLSSGMVDLVSDDKAIVIPAEHEDAFWVAKAQVRWDVESDTNYRFLSIFGPTNVFVRTVSKMQANEAFHQDVVSPPFQAPAGTRIRMALAQGAGGTGVSASTTATWLSLERVGVSGTT